MASTYFVLFSLVLGIISNTLAFSGISHKNAKNYSSITSLCDSSSPHFDLTDAINQKKYSDIARTLNETLYVYYSTSQLFTEITNLSWVVDVLSDVFESSLAKAEVTLCLTISFKLTKNHSNIDWRYMEDILNPSWNSESSEQLDSIQKLRKHLCRVVLDFRVNEPMMPAYNKSRKYAKKHDISFTKYAKRIISDIFGPDKSIPVGVLYNTAQVVNPDLGLLEQEIRHADFKLLNINYYPLKYMPLDYALFRDGLNEIEKQNEKFILEKNNYYREPDYYTQFMLTWNRFNPISNSYHNLQLVDEAENKVYAKSETKYLELFQDFVKRTLEVRQIGVFSGFQLNLRDDWTPKDLERNNIPNHFFVQKSETTPCKLGLMLDHISKRFSSIVVNEYTWSALAKFQLQLMDPKYMKTNCEIKPNFPKDFILIASDGIGEMWNETGKALENFLWDNPSIGDINLTTLVFSAQDIASSARVMDPYERRYSNSDSTYGVKKFLDSWVAANMTKIGCLADFGRMRLDRESTQHMGSWTYQRCHRVFSNVSLVVWQIQISDYDLINMYNLTYNSQISGLNELLTNLLIAKEIYLNENPNLDVMISLALDKVFIPATRRSTEIVIKYTNGVNWSSDSWEWLLFEWANIHNVKLMLNPAND